jgi:hypothetical protein
MMILLGLRFLFLAGLVGSAYWIGTDATNVEAYMLLCSSLLAYIYWDINFLRDHSRKNADRKLFDAFLSTLPSQGFISFIKTLDIGEHFQSCELDQLKSFCHGWNDPEHEFLDHQLEAKRKRLHELADAYRIAINLQTFTSRPDGYIGIPREWGHDKPAEYQAIIRELHELADQVVNAHADLVRTGRAKLGSEDHPHP